jgi:hypothetical protein
VDRLRQQSPADTLLVDYWLPTIRAAVALEREDISRAEAELQPTEPYELGGNRPPFSSGATLYPVYLHGESYLKRKDWTKAALEFQKILDNRGLVWNFPIGVLAHLQIARAYVGAGDIAQARAAYRDYFALWSRADDDIPILLRAQKEYASLSP